MRKSKGGTAIAHLDASSEKRLSGLVVFALAVAARRIEHHANIDPTLVGCDHRMEQCRLGKQKHPDVQGALGSSDWFKDRADGSVWKKVEGMRHYLASRQG